MKQVSFMVMTSVILSDTLRSARLKQVTWRVQKNYTKICVQLLSVLLSRMDSKTSSKNFSSYMNKDMYVELHLIVQCVVPLAQYAK